MGTCTAEHSTFRGWDAYILKNDYIRLVAVPSIGGRIMALDLGDYPFIFVDSELAGKLFSPEEHYGDGSLGAWKNYGGDKTWPAPQGWDNDSQWHGPPDPVLDSGIYRVDRFECGGKSAHVMMTSPPDPRTGVQISRAFTLYEGSSKVDVRLSFYNHTTRPIRWSIWDVVQLRAERRTPDGKLTYDPSCVITTPLNPNSVFPRGYNVMFGAQDNPQWQVDREKGLVVAKYLWQIGKIGVDSPGDWVAFCNTAEKYAFVTRFQVQPGAEYPDDGASVEVWTVGTGKVANLDYENSSIYLMESEVLSPLTTIEPGETTHMLLEWGVCRCDAQVTAVGSIYAASHPLEFVKVGDDRIHLKFRGGVFIGGELLAIFSDDAGNVLSQTTLGTVTPHQLVVIDHTLDMLLESRRLTLKVDTAELATALL
jgi:hypothetical protein